MFEASAAIWLSPAASSKSYCLLPLSHYMNTAGCIYTCLQGGASSAPPPMSPGNVIGPARAATWVTKVALMAEHRAEFLSAK